MHQSSQQGSDGRCWVIVLALGACVVASTVASARSETLGGQILHDASPFLDSALSNAQLASLQAGAEQGIASKAYQLALLYLYGHQGAVQIAAAPEMSAQYMRMAAQGGYGPAQTGFAILLLDGRGVQTDRAAALSWLQTAAANGSKTGDVNAMWLLGVETMKHGKNAEGAKWLEKAIARQPNHGQALFALAVANEYKLLGKDSPTSGSEAQKTKNSTIIESSQVSDGVSLAVSLYRRASQAGHTDASYHLALCLLYGRGVSQDMSEAASLLQQAAGRGHGAAAFWLGTVLLQGRGGVDIDYDRARALFEQAVASQDPRVYTQAVRAAKDMEELTSKATDRRDQVLGWIRQGREQQPSTSEEQHDAQEQNEASSALEWHLNPGEVNELTGSRSKSAGKRQMLGDALARARAEARGSAGVKPLPHGDNVFDSAFAEV